MNINEYMKSKLDDLNTTFKYLIEMNIRAEKENITELDLSYKKIGDDMIKILSLCTNLKNLTYLNLSNNNISDKGMEYFSKCDFLKNLTES
jgi:Leucine-rich repeat (LRR) protein